MSFFRKWFGQPLCCFPSRRVVRSNSFPPPVSHSQEVADVPPWTAIEPRGSPTSSSEKSALLSLPDEWQLIAAQPEDGKLCVWRVLEMRNTPNRICRRPAESRTPSHRSVEWPRFGVTRCVNGLSQLAPQECYIVMEWPPINSDHTVHIWCGPLSSWKQKIVACVKTVELCRHLPVRTRHIYEEPGFESNRFRLYFAWLPAAVRSPQSMFSPREKYSAGSSSSVGIVTGGRSTMRNRPRTPASSTQSFVSMPSSRRSTRSAVDSEDEFRSQVARERRLECARLWCIGRTAKRNRFIEVQLVPCRLQSLREDCCFILDSIPPGQYRKRFKWAAFLYEGPATCELTRTYANLSFHRMLEEKGRQNVLAVRNIRADRVSTEGEGLLHQWFWEILEEGNEFCLKPSTETSLADSSMLTDEEDVADFLEKCASTEGDPIAHLSAAVSLQTSARNQPADEEKIPSCTRRKRSRRTTASTAASNGNLSGSIATTSSLSRMTTTGSPCSPREKEKDRAELHIQCLSSMASTQTFHSARGPLTATVHTREFVVTTKPTSSGS